ncbi:MAG: DUF4286 family protein [Bacteroidales bacterium]|nr:DUF4286 family protein [Bacteroidales bacterium]
MLIYNITFALDSRLEDEFIGWLKNEFIPATTVDNGEYFTEPRLMRVSHELEPGTRSLALHLCAAEADDIDRWYADHGSRLFASMIDRWADRVAWFPTTLEII